MSKQFDIEKLAHLSRLKVNSGTAMQQQLESVLEFIDALQTVDVTDIKPLSHPIENNQPLRDDTVTETDQREQLQHNAPETHSGLYIVPQVIE